MLNDLNKTLKVLLHHNLPANLQSQLQITFAAPDAQFPPSGLTLPAIDLFLYDIRENRELRDPDWQVSRERDRPAIRQRPPVRVDCSYLITAWSLDTTDPAGTEHELLSEVLMILLRYPTLPPDLLQGALRNQDLPVPTAALQAGKLQSSAEFWQVLGGKAKAVLNYTVTLAVQPHRPEAPVTRVVPDGRVLEIHPGLQATAKPAVTPDKILPKPPDG